MPNLFAGVSVALQSMLTQQAAIEVIEHNVSNVNTPGYRRQQVVLKAGPAISSQGSTYSMGVGQIGTGVSVEKVKRFSTDFYDTRYRNEIQYSGQYSVESSVLEQLQSEFSETSDYGLTNNLNSFWSSWQSLAADPSNTSLKADVVDVARTLAQGINSRALSVKSLQSEQDSQIDQRVQSINEAASQVAALNGQIARVISIGEQPNDLMDERDGILDKLASLTGSTSSLQMNGEAVVSINGHVLVQGTKSFELSTQMDSTNHNFAKVVWADGQDLIPRSGELAGLIDARDNVLADQLDNLNTLSSALISRVNEIHSSGFATGKTSTLSTISNTVTGFGYASLDTGQTELTGGNYSVETRQNGTDWQFRLLDSSGNPVSVRLSDGSGYTTDWQNIPATTGGTINYDTGRGLTVNFGSDPALYSAAAVGSGAASVQFNEQQDLFKGTDAFSIGVNSQILANSNLLATAAAPNAAGDGSIARLISNVKTEKLLDGSQDTINEFYTSKTAEFGLTLNSVQTKLKNHDLVADAIDTQRQSVAGVNLNEEAANMETSQKAYEAAARLMTTVDEMLNTIINGMGLVGRG
jgi:flagellar hook-associated protein 1